MWAPVGKIALARRTNWTTLQAILPTLYLALRPSPPRTKIGTKIDFWNNPAKLNRDHKKAHRNAG
jgi:hypothetical protein